MKYNLTEAFKCLEIEEGSSFDAKALKGVRILQWLSARFKPQLLSERFASEHFSFSDIFAYNEHLPSFLPVDVPVLWLLPCYRFLQLPNSVLSQLKNVKLDTIVGGPAVLLSSPDLGW